MVSLVIGQSGRNSYLSKCTSDGVVGVGSISKTVEIVTCATVFGLNSATVLTVWGATVHNSIHSFECATVLTVSTFFATV